MEQYNISDIEYLIEAFYDGKTSIEEEQILYQYFSVENKNIPTHLLAEKKIFQELFLLQKYQTPDNFKDRTSKLIDSLAAKEKNNKQKEKTKSISLFRILSIAACVSILLGGSIYTFFKLEDNNPKLTDTYTNPQDAYLKAQETLLDASTALNKGFKGIDEMNNNLEKSNKIIAKNFKL